MSKGEGGGGCLCFYNYVYPGLWNPWHKIVKLTTLQPWPRLVGCLRDKVDVLLLRTVQGRVKS